MADDTRTARADAAAERARHKAMRPWYRKKRFILLGLILILVGLAVAGSGSDTDDTPEVAGSGGEQERGNTLFPGRPDSKDSDIERNIGQGADLSGYTATVTQAGFRGELDQFFTGGYLVADVTLLNRDDDAQPYNTFEWKLITPGGQIIDPFFGGDQLGAGDLVKGGTISGQLIWEVGDQKGDFYIIYDPTDFGDERGVWKVTV